MINYSIAMMGNPAKPEDPKKAYGVALHTDLESLLQIRQQGSEYH